MNPQVIIPDRYITDVETCLGQLIFEHRKMVLLVEAQQAAMKALDLRLMDDTRIALEAARVRIAALEQRRRTIGIQIGKQARFTSEPKLSQLVELFPKRKAELDRLRQELKAVIGDIQSRSNVSGKVANAVLGHLNTAMRLVAGVMERAGIYTKQGVPRMAQRIGVMEAIG